MKIVLILFFIISSVGLFSQTPFFTNFSTEQGLPSSEVYHVFQDSKGFMWFATNSGVSKYDGETFENFDIDNGLPDNTIFEIYEDYKGRVWFISISSQLSYYSNGKIVLYQYNNLLKDIKNNAPNPLKNCFYVDKNDNIILESFNCGTIKISNKGKLSVIETNMEKNFVYEINDRLFPKVRLKVPEILIQTQKDTFACEVQVNTIKTVGYANVEKFYNKILLSKGSEIFEIEKQKPVVNMTFNNRIIWLKKDKSDLLWMGFQTGGVNCYKNLDFENKKFSFFENLSVTSVFEDNCGGYWFTTLESGVYYTPSLEVLVYNENSGLKSDHVNTILPFKNKIYVGTRSNFLSVISGKNLEFIKLSDNPTANIKKLGKWNDIITVASNIPILLVNGKGKFKVNEIGDAKFFFHVGTHTCEVNKDTMLFTTTTGVYIVNKDTVKKMENIKHTTRSDVMLKDSEDYFWIGAVNGLFRLNYKTLDISNLGINISGLDSRILDICRNKDVLFLATKGKGILIFDKVILARITDKNGLTSNTVNSVVFKDGCLWAATNKGLNKITFKNGKYNMPEISIMNRNHGLPSDEINEVKIHDSVVYLATPKGLVYFNISTMKPSGNFPRLYFKDIEVNGEPIEIKNKYTLEYYENSIFISFNCLNYKFIGPKKYKYKLEGADIEWVISNDNSVRYSSLNPGKYQFLVYAMNEDNKWSDTPEIIEFEILTPYWETTWFRILVISVVFLLIILILLLVYYYHMKNIKKTYQFNQELNIYRQKALTQQMNPHFLFNSLNSIQYFIYKNDKEKSAEYLSKFSLLLRLILENSQQQQIPIRREIQAIELYLELESLRFRGDFKYEIIIDSLVEADFLMIPTLIIQPFVENAIWHGLLHKLEGNKKLVIHISREDDLIICSVEDNGIGRVKSREINERQKSHESLGTKITKNRLQLINSLYGNQLNLKYIDLMDGSGNPIGTKVVLNLPVIK